MATKSTKSPRIEPQQSVRFLISCIQHNNGGKVHYPNYSQVYEPVYTGWSLTLEQVDFDAVAKELGIVTRAAAAKRYERLLKSSKDSDKPTDTTAGAAAPSDGDEKPAKPAKPATTKRKALTISTPKDSPSKKAKAAPRGKKGKVKVEEKEDAEEETKADSESSLSDAPEDLEEPVKAEED
ncbi:hypothetical protein NHJ13051_000523 [Beauveria bassiana]